MSRGKNKAAALASQLAAGTTKHMSGLPQVILLGTPYTAAQIAAVLQKFVQNRADVQAAKATTQAKIVAEKADAGMQRAVMGALTAFIKSAYGNAPDILADFGLHPKTRAPLTIEAQVAASAKRAATRIARNTMGSKQKKAVKGNVVGVVVTPTVGAKGPTATTATVMSPRTPPAPTSPAT